MIPGWILKKCHIGDGILKHRQAEILPQRALRKQAAKMWRDRIPSSSPTTDSLSQSPPLCHPRSFLGHPQFPRRIQWGGRPLLRAARRGLACGACLAPPTVPPQRGWAAGESQPRRQTTGQAPGSAGDCFCLGPRRGRVRASRAPAPRSPSQSSATRAPRSALGSCSGWTGSFPLPVLCI